MPNQYGRATGVLVIQQQDGFLMVWDDNPQVTFGNAEETTRVLRRRIPDRVVEWAKPGVTKYVSLTLRKE